MTSRAHHSSSSRSRRQQQPFQYGSDFEGLRSSSSSRPVFGRLPSAVARVEDLLGYRHPDPNAAIRPSNSQPPITTHRAPPSLANSQHPPPPPHLPPPHHLPHPHPPSSHLAPSTLSSFHGTPGPSRAGSQVHMAFQIPSGYGSGYGSVGEASSGGLARGAARGAAAAPPMPTGNPGNPGGYYDLPNPNGYAARRNPPAMGPGGRYPPATTGAPAPASLGANARGLSSAERKGILHGYGARNARRY